MKNNLIIVVVIHIYVILGIHYEMRRIELNTMIIEGSQSNDIYACLRETESFKPPGKSTIKSVI